MGPHERGFCPRCLLAQTPRAETLKSLIAQWIDAIPEERRTPPAQLQQRLTTCQNCDHLYAGTCALCGCYVEYRAALAYQRCPDIQKRW